jgi:hypothetical protein
MNKYQYLLCAFLFTIACDDPVVLLWWYNHPCRNFNTYVEDSSIVFAQLWCVVESYSRIINSPYNIYELLIPIRNLQNQSNRIIRTPIYSYYYILRQFHKLNNLTNNSKKKLALIPGNCIVFVWISTILVNISGPINPHNAKNLLANRRFVMLFEGQDLFHWENCYFWDWSAIVLVGTMNFTSTNKCAFILISGRADTRHGGQLFLN